MPLYLCVLLTTTAITIRIRIPFNWSTFQNPNVTLRGLKEITSITPEVLLVAKAKSGEVGRGSGEVNWWRGPERLRWHIDVEQVRDVGRARWWGALRVSTSILKVMRWQMGSVDVAELVWCGSWWGFWTSWGLWRNFKGRPKNREWMRMVEELDVSEGQSRLMQGSCK